jgi:hypothetical protein
VLQVFEVSGPAGAAVADQPLARRDRLKGHRRPAKEFQVFQVFQVLQVSGPAGAAVGDQPLARRDRLKGHRRQGDPGRIPGGQDYAVSDPGSESSDSWPRLLSSLAMTSRCTSEVPSQMRSTRSSR